VSLISLEIYGTVLSPAQLLFTGLSDITSEDYCAYSNCKTLSNKRQGKARL